MYAKCEHLTEARAVFEALAKDDAISCNAMIKGYAMLGDLMGAVEVFSKMRYCSLKLSLLPILSLLGVSVITVSHLTEQADSRSHRQISNFT